MIELKDVSLKYDEDTVALNHINFTVKQGEFVFIVGASGAGKSSIIKLLLREKVPTKGTVLVNGYDLGKIKNNKIPEFRRTLGVVFQDFRLIPTLNVFDNVAFALRVTNVASRSIRQRVPYVLGLVGLAAKARNYPDQLSGGEQQRVAIARALVNNPPLLIADEPTGNIDPELSFEIVELLNEINRVGTTILMVTHDPLCASYSDRVLFLKDGKLFHELRKGEAERKGFFDQIIHVIALLGGDLNHVV